MDGCSIRKSAVGPRPTVKWSRPSRALSSTMAPSFSTSTLYPSLRAPNPALGFTFKGFERAHSVNYRVRVGKLKQAGRVAMWRSPVCATPPAPVRSPFTICRRDIDVFPLLFWTLSSEERALFPCASLKAGFPFPLLLISSAY